MAPIPITAQVAMIHKDRTYRPPKSASSNPREPDRRSLRSAGPPLKFKSNALYSPDTEPSEGKMKRQHAKLSRGATQIKGSKEETRTAVP